MNILKELKEIIYPYRKGYLLMVVTGFLLIVGEIVYNKVYIDKPLFDKIDKFYADLEKNKNKVNTNIPPVFIKKDYSYLLKGNWWIRSNSPVFATGNSDVSIKSTQTNLFKNLKLISIIASKKAILEDIKKNKQFFVKKGDKVLDTIEVVEIRKKSILLMEGGEARELFLFSINTTEMASQHIIPTNNVINSTNTPSTNEIRYVTAIATNRFGFQISDNEYLLSREKIKEYYTELLENPEELEKLLASFNHFKENNVSKGYKIDPQGGKELFEGLGLQKNDIIQNCNGMNLSNDKRVQYLIGKFTKNEMDFVKIAVNRNGIYTNIIYNIKD